jgi:hypothetical protein
VTAVEAFSGSDRRGGPGGYEWIDIEPDEFWEDSATNLSRLYGRYRESEGVTSR